jgi:serine/threonine protein kinase
MTEHLDRDDEPTGLSQITIPSEVYPAVNYRLERRIGEGGTAVAFFALRHAPDGIAPVVIKLVKPEVVASGGPTALLVIQKEAVALGRLNESVPPTPFVVRFIDTGRVSLHGEHRPALPWLALEYVHGGVEGTTLEERVVYSFEKTGYAFEPQRVAHLLRCLTSGLAAIHAVGVVHRDLTPNNVLCCGFGEAEIFKISDFGIAKPGGMSVTFGDMLLGTVGYTAPEQNSKDGTGVGPYTDVFSLACVLFYALTAQAYFDDSTPVRAILAIQSGKRRSIRDSKWLCPEMRERSEACDAIDQALAQATSVDPTLRPSVAQFAASLAPWIADGSGGPRPGRRLMGSLLNLSSPAQVSTWGFLVRHPTGDDRVIRSAAWDGDGRCFVATTRGLEFWNGTAWVPTQTERTLPKGLFFARRFEAGRWLVGGDEGTLAVFATDGVREVVRASDRRVTFLDASGRFDDLLVAIAQRPGTPPELWAMAARRWMKPLPLPKVAYLSALLRLDDSRWVLCGRLVEGGGFVAVYSPMHWEVSVLPTPATRAFVGGAAQLERGLALMVGTDGVTVRFDGERAQSSIAEGRPDLTAGAMDVLDREWVTSVGRLWVRDPERDARWQSVWKEASWRAPFVSLMADAGMVVAMTADGGILEGRAPWHTPPRAA